jgi:hypothetical protein
VVAPLPDWRDKEAVQAFMENPGTKAVRCREVLLKDDTVSFPLRKATDEAIQERIRAAAAEHLMDAPPALEETAPPAALELKAWRCPGCKTQIAELRQCARCFTPGCPDCVTAKGCYACAESGASSSTDPPALRAPPVFAKRDQPPADRGLDDCGGREVRAYKGSARPPG